jgi:hypothetical protein
MADENLWGEIDIDNWKQTPHIKNKIATEQDVKNGFAVFYIKESLGEHKPLEIPIPLLAYQKNDETDENILVVIIQGEKINNEEVVGVRYFTGGNGICKLAELIPITI